MQTIQTKKMTPRHSSYFAMKVAANRNDCEKLFTIQKEVYRRTVAIQNLEALIRLDTNHHLKAGSLCPVRQQFTKSLMEIEKIKRNGSLQIGFSSKVEQLQIVSSLCEVMYNSTCGAVKKPLLLWLYTDIQITMFNFSVPTVRCVLPRIEKLTAMEEVQKVLCKWLILELDKEAVFKSKSICLPSTSKTDKLIKRIHAMSSTLPFKVGQLFQFPWSTNVLKIKMNESFKSHFTSKGILNKSVENNECQLDGEIYRWKVTMATIQCLIAHEKKGSTIRSKLNEMKNKSKLT